MSSLDNIVRVTKPQPLVVVGAPEAQLVEADSKIITPESLTFWHKIKLPKKPLDFEGNFKRLRNLEYDVAVTYALGVLRHYEKSSGLPRKGLVERVYKKYISSQRIGMEEFKNSIVGRGKKVGPNPMMDWIIYQALAHEAREELQMDFLEHSYWVPYFSIIQDPKFRWCVPGAQNIALRLIAYANQSMNKITEMHYRGYQKVQVEGKKRETNGIKRICKPSSLNRLAQAGFVELSQQEWLLLGDAVGTAGVFSAVAERSRLRNYDCAVPLEKRYQGSNPMQELDYTLSWDYRSVLLDTLKSIVFGIPKIPRKTWNFLSLKTRDDRRAQDITQEGLLTQWRAMVESALRERDQREKVRIPPQVVRERNLKGEYKTRTVPGCAVVAIDQANSVNFFMNQDPDQAEAEVDRLFENMFYTIRNLGGWVLKTIGDGTFNEFGAHAPSYTSAARAVEGSLRIRNNLTELRHQGAKLPDLRIGVATGPLKSKFRAYMEEYDVHGNAAKYASRFEGAAPPGGIFITEETAKLCRNSFVLGDLETRMGKNNFECRGYLVRDLNTLVGMGRIDITSQFYHDYFQESNIEQKLAKLEQHWTQELIKTNDADYNDYKPENWFIDQGLMEGSLHHQRAVAIYSQAILKLLQQQSIPGIEDIRLEDMLQAGLLRYAGKFFMDREIFGKVDLTKSEKETTQELPMSNKYQLEKMQVSQPIKSLVAQADRPNPNLLGMILNLSSRLDCNMYRRPYKVAEGKNLPFLDAYNQAFNEVGFPEEHRDLIKGYLFDPRQ